MTLRQETNTAELLQDYLDICKKESPSKYYKVIPWRKIVMKSGHSSHNFLLVLLLTC